MADIVWPDIGNALLNVQRIRGMEQQAQQFEEERRQREAERALAPEVQAAMGGDNKALGRIAAQNPNYAMKIAPLLDRLDNHQRQVLKDAADFTTQAGMGVLNAPPEMRPAAYAAAVAEAKRRGMDTSTWPTEWGPQTEGWLHFNVQKAVPVATWFAENQRTAREGAKSGDLLLSGDGTITRPGGYTGTLAGYESGSNPQAVNPQSGAGGLFQFIPQTWATVRSQNPDLNLPENVLQATADQQKAAEERFRAANAKALQGYGLPVNPATLYIAHRAGADGARTILSAPPGTPMASIVPKAWIDQNPDMRGTVGDFVMMAQRRFGGAPQPQGGAPAWSPSPIPAQAPGGLPQMAQGDNITTGVPNGGQPPKPANAYTDILSKLPQGAQLLLDPTTRMPRYDKDGRVAVQFPDGSRNFIEIPKPGKGGEAGPLTGTGMDQQMMNILLTGDPSTQAYAAAYAHMSRPRTTVDGEGRPITVQPMDMGMFQRPTFGRGGQPTGPAPLPEGTVTQEIPGGGTVTVMPSIADKGPTQKEQADLRTARAEADKITAAAQTYLELWRKATPVDRAKALTGANTPLNTAYNNFALLAKGDALYNLGVLNGPDLDIIRRTIADPSTMKSGMVSEADVSNSVEQVLGILRKGIEAREKQLQGAKGGQGGGQSGQTYTGPDGSPILWKQIEDTAKARGISTDDVIKQLGLKPFGAR